MENDVYQTVHDCRSCAARRSIMNKAQKPLHLFPPSGPLEFIEIDILRSLPRTSMGFTNVVVMNNQLTKLEHTSPSVGSQHRDVEVEVEVSAYQVANVYGVGDESGDVKEADVSTENCCIPSGCCGSPRSHEDVTIDEEASSFRNVRCSDIKKEGYSELHVPDIPRVSKRRGGKDDTGTQSRKRRRTRRG